MAMRGPTVPPNHPKGINMKREPKIEFYQDKAGKHRWRILASNGQTIAASSQGYATQADCKRNMQRIREILNASVDQVTVWSKWKKNTDGVLPSAAQAGLCQVRYRDGSLLAGEAVSFVWVVSPQADSPYDIVEYRHAT